MRTYWLGLIALLCTAGCAHEGRLLPQAGAVPLTEDGQAAVTGGEGVRLLAYLSGWRGQPGDLERHFTVLHVRLENNSGRPLGVRYENFELDARGHYVAKDPNVLGELLAARSGHQSSPPVQQYGTNLRRESLLPPRPPRAVDTTYSPYNGTTPHKSLPCYTCTSATASMRLPTADMLSSALAEGPLEPGQVREGFLFFEEPLVDDTRATLTVKLVDASSGEPFGALNIPFEVR